MPQLSLTNPGEFFPGSTHIMYHQPSVEYASNAMKPYVHPTKTVYNTNTTLPIPAPISSPMATYNHYNVPIASGQSIYQSYQPAAFSPFKVPPYAPSTPQTQISAYIPSNAYSTPKKSSTPVYHQFAVPRLPISQARPFNSQFSTPARYPSVYTSSDSKYHELYGSSSSFNKRHDMGSDDPFGTPSDSQAFSTPMKPKFPIRSPILDSSSNIASSPCPPSKRLGIPTQQPLTMSTNRSSSGSSNTALQPTSPVAPSVDNIKKIPSQIPNPTRTNPKRQVKAEPMETAVPLNLPVAPGNRNVTICGQIQQDLYRIWELNPCMPTLESRRAWAAARGVHADKIHSWFNRRKIRAKNCEKPWEGEYQLDINAPGPATDLDNDVVVKREALNVLNTNSAPKTVQQPLKNTTREKPSVSQKNLPKATQTTSKRLREPLDDPTSVLKSAPKPKRVKTERKAINLPKVEPSSPSLPQFSVQITKEAVNNPVPTLNKRGRPRREQVQGFQGIPPSPPPARNIHTEAPAPKTEIKAEKIHPKETVSKSSVKEIGPQKLPRLLFM
ncbi:hypothetical protein M422DRAFT_54445 [Sphaerobolus stellatus SS14]|uniref:Homeobox domain-containing protein n=1 Tax=Sphaerobolus stellatus (strain SS14) TaxID=990650 RepID=A0A0C9U408_SPHS4|nr:hypothetical protein M422DRAFT_54445 [Sphaerobolus stellatus SS14]